MGSSPAMHAVVIAGGSGTRFWPVSRARQPKQLLNLSGADSLLHASLARVAALSPTSAWWMVVGAAHAAGCRAVAPEVAPAQVLVEPRARNTAPAIGLAALHLQRRDPAALMVVLPADHHVTDSPAFCAALQQAAAVAERGAIVTLGIRPDRPETGYGYIQAGDADARGAGAHRVARFVEKPDRATAERFLAAGGYLWNAGIFVMRPQAYLDEVAAQLPQLHACLQSLAPHIDTAGYEAAVADVYARIEGISIDYGVMEHARDVAVVPVSCGWSDVGSWSALGAVVPADAQGNVTRGRAVALDSRRCITYASDGHVVGLVGVEDLVVVHTEDATLVAPAGRAQEVRGVLEEIVARKWGEYL